MPIHLEPTEPQDATAGSDRTRTIVSSEPYEVPWLSLVLGYGPMLPILGGAALAWWLRGPTGEVIATLATLWGCAILLFLSGVRRGVSFRTEGGATLGQIVTMFALFSTGFAASVALLFGSSVISLALLCVGYLGVAVIDPIAARQREAPAFLSRLRPPQMALGLIGFLALLTVRLTS